MYQNEEFAFLISLSNQKKIPKTASSSSRTASRKHTQKKLMKRSNIGFIGFCKKHFLSDKGVLCLKTLSYA